MKNAIRENPVRMLALTLLLDLNKSSEMARVVQVMMVEQGEFTF